MNRITGTSKHPLLLLLLVTAFLSCGHFSFAQPVLPQHSLSVTCTQGIYFGTFCLSGGAGGTVTVGVDGSRTSGGGIILLSKAPTAHPAIFEIKLCQGRNVTLSFDPTITLSCGSGPGLTLNIGPTDQGGSGAHFITKGDCNFITPLRVGGTLIIPATAVPGLYTGNFAITFDHQ